MVGWTEVLGRDNVTSNVRHRHRKKPLVQPASDNCNSRNAPVPANSAPAAALVLTSEYDGQRTRLSASVYEPDGHGHERLKDKSTRLNCQCSLDMPYTISQCELTPPTSAHHFRGATRRALAAKASPASPGSAHRPCHEFAS